MSFWMCFRKHLKCQGCQGNSWKRCVSFSDLMIFLWSRFCEISYKYWPSFPLFPIFVADCYTHTKVKDFLEFEEKQKIPDDPTSFLLGFSPAYRASPSTSGYIRNNHSRSTESSGLKFSPASRAPCPLPNSCSTNTDSDLPSTPFSSLPGDTGLSGQVFEWQS